MKNAPKENKSLLFNIDWNSCIQCGACIAVCPLEEIFISPFDTIAVGEPCSLACLACEEICPVSAITHRPAVFNHSDEVFARVPRASD